MRVILKLTERNIKKYLYTKSNVFLSFLSIIILVAIYVLFLGNLQADGLKDVFGDVPEVDLIISGFLITGIVAISTITIPLAVLSDIVVDVEKKILDDFYTAPIKRSHILIGYILAAVIVGFFIAMISFVVAMSYYVFMGGEWLSFADWSLSTLIIFLSTVCFSAMSFFIVSFIKSLTGVSVINTVVGTLVGFLGGVYIPLGNFPSAVQDMTKSLPIVHSVGALKQIVLEKPVTDIFNNGTFMDSAHRATQMAEYRTDIAVDISLFGFDFNTSTMILFIIGFGILFFILSLFRLNRFTR